MKTKSPGNQMTVIIRDDGPMVHCGDSPSYRTVRVELTMQQMAALALRQSYTHNGVAHYEEISRVIIEEGTAALGRREEGGKV